MKNRPKSKTKTPTKHDTDSWLTANALACVTGRDRRTLSKDCAGLPAKIIRGRRCYRLADVQAVVNARRHTVESAADLKKAVLEQQYRKLKLETDIKLRKLLHQDVLQKIFAEHFAEISRVLETRLEREYPSLVCNLDLVGCRAKGKQLNDAIRAELYKIVTKIEELSERPYEAPKELQMATA
jgi:hypothetical protein